jgi:hypothetical protein
MNMALTDGPSDSFNHVWVTIKSISLHTSANQVWDPLDATWKTITLPAPITIDLAQLNNGALNQTFANMQLPVGTYRQIRFFFAGTDDTLTSSAQAIHDNETTPLALQWNDQVEYVDQNSGLVSEAPLEVAYPKQGVQLVGAFSVTAGSTLNLVTDFDLDKIIVPFHHDGMQTFTMRPLLRYFDLNQAGAIAGTIDPANLCQSGINTSSCAYNLIVHAELLSSDGTRHYATRSTMVNPATGQFVLYPLDLKDSANNTLSYDIVIRGRNMETMLVKGVTPSGTPSSGATQVQSTPISATVNATEYGAQFASALQPLTSGYAIFQQTLASGQVPYEVRWNNTDPYTGMFFAPFKLENAGLHVANFNSGNALSFSSVTPTEGSGSYSVATNEAAYYNVSSNVTVQPPGSGSQQTFVPPVPTLAAGLQNGSVSGNLSISNATAYDHATLVISRFANIITTQDVSSLLSSGGSFSVTGLPAGSTSNPQLGAYYYGYLRLWKAGAHLPAKIVPIPGFIDLRTTNSVTGFNVTVSGS